MAPLEFNAVFIYCDCNLLLCSGSVYLLDDSYRSVSHVQRHAMRKC